MFTLYRYVLGPPNLYIMLQCTPTPVCLYIIEVHDKYYDRLRACIFLYAEHYKETLNLWFLWKEILYLLFLPVLSSCLCGMMVLEIAIAWER